jgi:hypothetical protein
VVKTVFTADAVDPSGLSTTAIRRGFANFLHTLTAEDWRVG